MHSGRGDRGVVLSIVGGFVFGGWTVVAGRVKPTMVIPVDVLKGGQFEIVDAAPWPVPVDQLGLVQADHGFGEGVIVGISLAANGNGRTCLSQTFGVADRQVLPGLGLSSFRCNWIL